MILCSFSKTDTTFTQKLLQIFKTKKGFLILYESSSHLHSFSGAVFSYTGLRYLPLCHKIKRYFPLCHKIQKLIPWTNLTLQTQCKFTRNDQNMVCFVNIYLFSMHHRIFSKLGKSLILHKSCILSTQLHQISHVFVLTRVLNLNPNIE